MPIEAIERATPIRVRARTAPGFRQRRCRRQRGRLVNDDPGPAELLDDGWGFTTRATPPRTVRDE